MEQQPFDKAIKESLENMEVPFNAEHWQQMELLLHNLPVGDETAVDAHFDDLIKHKMGAIEVPPSDLAWGNILAGLEKTELTDVDFDNAIGEKIGNIQSEAVFGWENLEQALEEATVADTQFDAEVYAKLNHIQPTYKTSHWQRLVNRLNAEFALREKLYRYKLVETTLIILLLLQFYQYPTGTSPQFNNIIKQSNTEVQMPKPMEKRSPVAPTLPVTETQKKAIAPAKSSKVNSTQKTKKPLVAARENIENASTLNNARNLKQQNAEQQALEQARGYGVSPTIGSLNPNRLPKNSLTISVSEMNQHLTQYTETNKSIISIVPSLQPNFIESLYIIPLGCKDCRYSKVPARVRLGLVANMASNSVYLSGGDILGIDPLNSKGFGYGSGFTMGFKYGRWEIETGINYAAKRYDPNIADTPQANTKRTHFQRIHLQNLHLPVNLRYNYAVLGKGKWHLYTQTGVALNVILRAEYDLAEIASISRSRINDITTSRLSLIDYNNGVLAGDGFKSNRYLSLNIGGGVERYIAPNWSIFIQPDFHFHFSGNRIGPTEDRINTLSLSFGARKSL